MRKFAEMDYSNVLEVASLEKEVFGNNAWSYNLLLNELPQNNKHYILCYEDNVLAGYGGFAQVLDEGHIMNIAVKDGYRNSGIGTAILEKFDNLAKILGINGLTLEVREGNAPARNLYEKQKFVLSGIRKRYYSDGENACIYWKLLHGGDRL